MVQWGMTGQWRAESGLVCGPMGYEWRAERGLVCGPMGE